MRVLARSLLASVATAVVLFALLLAVAVWAPQNQATIRRHLHDAVASGLIIEKGKLGPFDRLYTYTYLYDCIIFGTMLAPSRGVLTNAMSNRRPVIDSTVEDPRVPFSFCQEFLRALPEFKADGSERVQFASYDRYILGMRVLGRILLSIMPLNAMHDLLFALLYGLLGGIVVIAAWRLVRAEAGSPERARAAAFIAIAGCFASFYGLSYYGPTLNFGPLDATHFAFILISLVVPLGTMRPTGLALFAAAYGTLVAYFEFLTGGIPIALALSPLLLALGFKGGWRDYLGKLMVIWSSFCVAVVVSFALKTALAELFFDEADTFMGPLLLRMHGDYGPLPGATGNSWIEIARYLYNSYAYQSRNIAWGAPALGTALITVALATIVLFSWRNRRTLRTFAHPVLAATWLSLGALIAWAAVFFQHTMTHPFSQVRMLVVPIIAATILVTMELIVPVRANGEIASSE